MLRSHHRYALQSVYLVGYLMVNDWYDVSVFGRYWGGDSLGAVMIGCVVYGFQYGLGCVVCGLVCSTPSGFSSGCCSRWGVFGLTFSLCVCVRARARARARGLVQLVFLQERKKTF